MRWRLGVEVECIHEVEVECIHEVVVECVDEVEVECVQEVECVDEVEFECVQEEETEWVKKMGIHEYTVLVHKNLQTASFCVIMLIVKITYITQERNSYTQSSGHITG